MVMIVWDAESERLFEAGALDVWTTPIFMKKPNSYEATVS